MENTYAYHTDKKFKRAEVRLQAKEEVYEKEMMTQNGEKIVFKVRRVTQDNSCLNRKTNLTDIKAVPPEIKDMIINYFSGNPFKLSMVELKSQIQSKAGYLSDTTLSKYCRMLNIPTIYTAKQRVKNDIIWPEIKKAIVSMDYNCTINCIVKYLGKTDFHKKLGVKPNREFIHNIIKQKTGAKYYIGAGAKADWRKILNGVS